METGRFVVAAAAAKDRIFSTRITVSDVAIVLAVHYVSITAVCPRSSDVVSISVVQIFHHPRIIDVPRPITGADLQRNFANRQTILALDADDRRIYTDNFEEVGVRVVTLVAGDGRYLDVLAELLVHEQPCQCLGVHRVVHAVSTTTSVADADQQIVVHDDSGQSALTARWTTIFGITRRRRGSRLFSTAIRRQSALAFTNHLCQLRRPTRTCRSANSANDVYSLP